MQLTHEDSVVGDRWRTRSMLVVCKILLHKPGFRESHGLLTRGMCSSRDSIAGFDKLCAVSLGRDLSRTRWRI